MKIVISMKKKHVYALLLLAVALASVNIAIAVTSTQAYYPLQDVSRSSGDLTSVDANSNEVIDQAGLLQGTNLIPASGNVGIGTTSPSQRLHVVGNALVTGTVYASAYGSTSPLLLQAPSGVTRVYIDESTGNVGIGTTSPGNRLTVIGPSGTHIITANDGTTNFGIYAGGLSGGGSGASIGTTTSSPLRLFTGNADRVTIDTAGNVGIGTQSPTQKLDVIGYVRGATGLCIGGDCRTSWAGVRGGFYAVDLTFPNTNTCRFPNPLTGSCSCPAGTSPFSDLGYFVQNPQNQAEGGFWVQRYECL